jgi:cytidylate kinase
MKKIIIAMDGYSSSGKSTMARSLAETIGYTYVDTGAMYRAVTLYCMENDLIHSQEVNEEKLKQALPYINISFCLNKETGRPETFLNGENVEKEIRSMKVANYVSVIAALPYVRQALVAMQQKMGEKKGLVMDGRDVGTVVFPEAELKIFVTADPEIRARRRYEELIAKGTPASFEEVLTNIKERDHMDTTRTEGPLKKASDALVLDNSYMTISEQMEWLLVQYKKVVGD